MFVNICKRNVNGYKRLNTEFKLLQVKYLPRWFSNLKLFHLKIRIMNSMKNRVQLIGNPGMSPEVKELDNGTKLAKFNLATNEYYKNQKG